MTAKKIASVKASKGGKEVRTIDNVKESFEAWKKVELDKLDIAKFNCDRADNYWGIDNMVRNADMFKNLTSEGLHRKIQDITEFTAVVYDNMIDCLKNLTFEEMKGEEPIDLYEPCTLRTSECPDRESAFRAMIRWSIVKPFADNYLRCWHTVKDELEEIKDAAVD